jgi:type III secretory pathway component EscV
MSTEAFLLFALAAIYCAISFTNLQEKDSGSRRKSRSSAVWSREFEQQSSDISNRLGEKAMATTCPVGFDVDKSRQTVRACCDAMPTQPGCESIQYVVSNRR